MKLDAQLFLDHIRKASVGGVINELVFGNRLSFALTDETKSVVSICSAGLVEEETNEIGIFDSGLFSRSIQYAKDIIFAKDQAIEMNLVDNRLVFKNGDNEFRFLLSAPKAIQTKVNNPDDVLEKVGAGPAVTIGIDSSIIDQCLKAIQLIAPDKCTFLVESGKVKLSVGDEVKHIAIVNLGVAKSRGKFKLVVKPDFLSKVLSVLPPDKEIVLSLRDGMPLVFTIPGYVVLLASMEIE
jgi:hypothetical protein